MKHIFIVLFVFFVSCRNDAVVITDKKIDFKKVKLDFLKIDFSVPASYEKMDFESYSTYYYEHYGDSLKVSFNKAMRYLKYKTKGNTFFVDTNEPANTWIVIRGKYVHLNKEIAKIYIQNIKQSIQKTHGGEAEIVSQSFLQKGKKKFIKILIKYTNEYTTYFRTHYLINSKYNTYSIDITNLEKEDFQDIAIQN